MNYLTFEEEICSIKQMALDELSENGNGGPEAYRLRKEIDELKTICSNLWILSGREL